MPRGSYRQTRNRYCVSQAILQGRSTPAGIIGRISATTIEGLVEQQVREWLPRERQAGWPGLSQKERRDELNRLVAKVVVRASSITMELTATGLAARCAAGFESSEDGVVHIETTIVRRHRARVMLARDELERRQPDRTMLKAIAEAHHLRRRHDAWGLAEAAHPTELGRAARSVRLLKQDCLSIFSV